MMPSDAWIDDSLLSPVHTTKFYSLEEHGLCPADYDALYDIVVDEIFCMGEKPLVAEDYVAVSRRPQRYEEGWYIEFFPTEIGDRCLYALQQGLIWNTGAQAPAVRESLEYWFEELARMDKPAHKCWDRLEKSTHPALRPAQEMLVPAKTVAWLNLVRQSYIGSNTFADVQNLGPEYKPVHDYAEKRIVELWIERVQRIDRPDHPDFGNVKRLTSEKFKPVQDEAFLQKMKVWAPKHETVPGP